MRGYWYPSHGPGCEGMPHGGGVGTMGRVRAYKKGAVRQGLAEVTKIGGLFFGLVTADPLPPGTLTGETACVSSESSN